jgi:hypothetical protein
MSHLELLTRPPNRFYMGFKYLLPLKQFFVNTAKSFFYIPIATVHVRCKKINVLEVESK